MSDTSLPTEFRVDAEECEGFRERRREGQAIRQIAEESDKDRSQRAVQRHVSGDCDHHDGGDPLYEWFQEWLAERARGNGGQLIISTSRISGSNPLTPKQVGQLIRMHQERDSGPTIKRWGGQRSKWVVRTDSDAPTEPDPKS